MTTPTCPATTGICMNNKQCTIHTDGAHRCHHPADVHYIHECACGTSTWMSCSEHAEGYQQAGRIIGP